jgi:uncharacterized membrane protein
MMPFESRVSQLVRWNAKKGRVYVRTIAMDLTGEARDLVGRVFGTLAVDGSAKNGDSLAAFIEDALTQGLSDAHRKLPKDANQEQAFQAAISKVNHMLSRLLDGDGLPISPEKVCGAVVSQKGLEIVAACWGQPSLLLFHPAAGQTMIIDLLADSESDQTYVGRPAPRGFTNIVAGRMGKRDRLVVATRDLREVFGEEKLCAVISANEPDAATEILRDTLAPMGDTVALAVLVADAVMAEDSTRPRIVKTEPAEGPNTTQRSIDTLLATQSSTKDILTPRFVPSLLAKLGGGAGVAAGWLWKSAKSAFTAPTAPQPNIVKEDSAEVGASVEWVDASPQPRFPRLRSAGRTSWAVMTFLPSLLSKERRQEISATLDQATDRFLNAVIGWFNALSTKSRVFLFASLGLLFVLNQGILVVGWQQRQEQKVADYERAVAAIEQKIDSSEASMIYRDEARARQLLDEAAIAIEALPGKKDAEEQTRSLLRRKVAATMETLRRAVPLDAPEVVASIASEERETQLRRMAAGTGGLWMVSSDGQLFKIAAGGEAPSKVADMPSGSNDIFLPLTSGLLVGGRDSLSLVAAAGKSSPRTVDWAGVETSIEDADVYGSRLYVLDSSHNRILRLPATEKGFAKPQFYVKDGTDLSAAVSIAIDGSLYVLAKNGAITKLESGTRLQFGVQPAEPAVTAAVKLRTSENSDSLYVLERSPGRILRFNKKSGMLAAQYTSDALADANDFLIDEKAGQILAVAGNRVLKFGLPELK